MSHSADAQNLEFAHETDAEFFLQPDTGQTIALASLIVQIRTSDGLTVLKTLTVGSGLTVNGVLGVQVKFATDDTSLQGPGRYLYEARDPTLGARDLVAWGRLLVWRR